LKTEIETLRKTWHSPTEWEDMYARLFSSPKSDCCDCSQSQFKTAKENLKAAQEDNGRKSKLIQSMKETKEAVVWRTIEEFPLYTIQPLWDPYVNCLQTRTGK
jgi:hypothetical protein